MKKSAKKPVRKVSAKRQRKVATKPAAPVANKAPAVEATCAIVGIGASAGGLEALELFLRHVPADSGLAYVIVQHLDPARKAIVAELLQRVTGMPVTEVRDRTRVRPDCVYIIPPNKDMSVLHGVLHLLEPVAPHGVRLPIDFFFRSLAQDRQEHSIGVVLSGMGSDGTLGLRAIKESGGVVLVQELASAKFDGMPRSAIEAGLADFVAPAEKLPELIVAYRQRTGQNRRADQSAEDISSGDIGKVLVLLRARTGHDFSLYRPTTLRRRIERRMGVHQIGRLPDYVRYLRENPQEVEILFKELLIGVTNFFRDPVAWEKLRDEVLPELIKARSDSRGVLRAWVPGCSTGEEAYSLAMVFKEALAKAKPGANLTLQIYATDLDQEAIRQARLGVYPENIAADVLPRRLGRFFVREDGRYRVNKEIREMVIFAPQNLIMDPPFTKLDLLSCRNLLIYLTPELQRKLFPVFHYSLNPGGVLFLGSAESIGDFTGLFAPLCAKERLFRRNETGPRGVPIEFPTRFVAVTPSREGVVAQQLPPGGNFQPLVEGLLLQNHAPAAVLVNGDGDILYVSGRTGKFLEPATGKANWNVAAMARDELRYEITGALQRALREKTAVALRGLSVRTEGGAQGVELHVRPVDGPPPHNDLAMIVFVESPAPSVPVRGESGGKGATRDARLAELARALQEARQEVQTCREEMQSSQEELRSMNEELQSANEELQSTNEELTTSKEEMQSLNEELHTVNAELQSKLEELSAANNDMKNLLNSTDIATVFLDESLRIRRFTSQANQLFKLIPGDVGRPITDLASELCYPELADDAREVLRTLVFAEKPIAARADRWYAVRIMPYRTIENRIDGVVITFSDITTSKQLEAELREKCRQLASGTAQPTVPTDGTASITKVQS
ncbi:MAG TPA: chemotaxis protein CheB [Opitutaceae bacterium]|nr:chemotaxis protein CheB [Opitutaceae bacterium]